MKLTTPDFRLIPSNLYLSRGNYKIKEGTMMELCTGESRVLLILTNACEGQNFLN